MSARTARSGVCTTVPRAPGRSRRPPRPAAGPSAISAIVKSNSSRATKSIAGDASRETSGSTATLAPTNPTERRVRPLQRLGHLDVPGERRGTRVQHRQLVLARQRYHVVQGEARRGRVDQPAAGHDRGELGQPRRVPEGPDFPLSLVPRARPRRRIPRRREGAGIAYASCGPASLGSAPACRPPSTPVSARGGLKPGRPFLPELARAVPPFL